MIIALFGVSVSSANYLGINNPRTWGSYYPKVNELKLFVNPCGLYTEYALEYSISLDPKNSSTVTPSDSLEITYNANLLLDDVVNDSWLWVGDTIVKAMVIDKRTGTAIYEDIVKRRKDPSLLTYNNGYCELKVFPLAFESFRRFRYSFLRKNEVNALSISSVFNSSILGNNYDKYSPTIYIKENKEFLWDKNTSPSPKLKYDKDTLIDNENYYIYKTNEAFSYENLTFRFSSDNQNGFFWRNNKYRGEKYYQFSINPSSFDEFVGAKKTLVALDFDKNTENNYDVNAMNEFKANFVSFMSSMFNKNDTFNICIGKDKAYFAFDGWRLATSENLDSALRFVNANNSSITNFLSLMEGVNSFVKNEKSPRTSVLLFSNTAFFNNAEKSIEAFKIIKPEINTNIAYNIVYYIPNNNYIFNYYYNNKVYYNNELLYDLICDYAQGTRIGDINRNRQSMFKMLNSIYSINISDLKVKVNVADGFAYNDFVSSSLLGSLSGFGKIYGDTINSVEIYGMIDNLPVKKVFALDSLKKSNVNYRTNQFWAKRRIDELISKYENTQSLIDETIEISRAHRALCNNTAFLALEAWMMPEEKNGEQTNDVKELPEIKATLSTYPEPANKEVNINLALEDKGLSVWSITVYDMAGKAVKKFANFDITNGSLNLVWDLSDDSGAKLNSGIYVIMIETNKGVVSAKLNIVR
jgi:Ca-activated chloride channel family protein